MMKRFRSAIALMLSAATVLAGLSSLSASAPQTKVAYGSNIKAKDVQKYLVSDFIDARGEKVTGVESDPKASSDYQDTDYVIAGSFQNYFAYLQELYGTSGAGDILVDDIVEDAMDDEALPDDGMMEMPTEEAEAVPKTDGGESISTGNTSTTNVQVEGVDESDIIKTDGKYIYYMTPQGVNIVQVSGSKMKIANSSILADTSKDAMFTDMYISGKNLILIGSQRIPLEKKSTGNYYYGGKFYTTIWIYDISKPSAPKVKREVSMEGNLLTSRLYNNTIYFATNTYMQRPGIATAIDETLPNYYDSKLGSDRYVISPKRLRLPKNKQTYSSNMMLLAAIGLNDKTTEPIKPHAFMGNGMSVYMNKSAFYFTRNIYDKDFGQGTSIYRMAIDGTKYSLSGYNYIKGNPINQYAMDEYKGNFRIAATEYSQARRQQESSITIFDTSKEMKQLGKVTGLGPNEQIYSVRFKGDVGYVVTFRQMDPLYVVDLSNPAKPETLGALKIPGYSTYMHPFKDKYVIGFGREVSDDGSTRDLGLKLSLFDVSDPRNPKEIQKRIYGEDSRTYSEATHNPRSIMIDARKDTIAFPIQYTSKTAKKNETGYTYNSWAGGVLLHVSPEQGFTNKLTVKNESEQNAWYQGDSRFCYINETLYFVSDNKIRAFDYTNYKEKASLNLPIKFNGGRYYGDEIVEEEPVPMAEPFITLSPSPSAKAK